MKFPEILKELRKEKNLTHKKLAEEIGYSKAIIGFWEKGEKQPTAEAIISLAVFFNVSTDYLLGLEDENGTKIHISNSFNNNNGNINFKR